MGDARPGAESATQDENGRRMSGRLSSTEKELGGQRPSRSTATSHEGVVVNEVRLVGRVSGSPLARDLPSGDRVVTWRLVVGRGPGARGPSVDTIDCAVWAAGLLLRAERLADDQVVEVEGHLRRRFWRGAGGPASRYEVEVVRLRRWRPAVE